MPGGSTYQNKPENRPEGLSKYLCISKLLSPDTDCSPWDQGPIIWYQFGKKTCYIPKISKLYVEKDVRAHQQITFITLDRFAQPCHTKI